MMMVYFRQDGVVRVAPWDGAGFPPETVWVDVEHAAKEELEAIQSHLGIDLPSGEEVKENLALNRMYQSDGISYMTAKIITKSNGPYPETQPVSFMLSEHMLVTLRGIAPTSFKSFAQQLVGKARDFTCGAEIMEGLLEAMVTRVAHNSELVVSELDGLSHQIFDTYAGESKKSDTNSSEQMKNVLRKLGAVADLNSQINESLYSFARLITFFKEDQEDNKYLVRKLDVLSADVKELIQQTGFLSDKITFQLDATLGMINVEQNMIMKVLSIFTVMIMPPTLIGSIYGMNFAHMPELQEMWGYPAALSVMLVCALVPYIYFRNKRWL